MESTYRHTDRVRGVLPCTELRLGVLENILGMALLMALGVSVTVAVLIGFIYYLEVQND